MSQLLSEGETLIEDAQDPGGPSESAIHVEHRAALDATVFRGDRARCELVLELEAGELRLRRSL